MTDTNERVDRRHARHSTLTPAERSMRARKAVQTRWAKTEDRTAATATMRAAAFRRFEDEVDPERRLPADERQRRAEQLQQAHMTGLALKRQRDRAAS